MTWLDEILDQHSSLESPMAFWKWSALAAVSAVLKDNVYLDKFIYKLYPNIYVMLHADSGLRKGPPINMAKQLVNFVGNTKVITGRSSIQGILKDMGTGKTEPGGKISSANTVFICSSELTSSIVADPVATTILTDMYDRHYNEGDWKSLLKMESFSLKSPTVTMLAGTNEAHSEEFFIRKDVQGGYFARTFIIYEKEVNKLNSLMYAPDHIPDLKKSAEYLKELSKLRGPFIIEDDTRRFFDDWYTDFRASVKIQQVKDQTGTLNRLDDSVLKISMLLALARSPELKITRETMEEAIGECEKLVGAVRKTTAARGKSVWASHKALVIEELLAREPHMISRTQLNKKYYLHANVSEWDEVMLSLEAAGFLSIQPSGNVIMYVMSDAVANELKKHMQGKIK